MAKKTGVKGMTKVRPKKITAKQRVARVKNVAVARSKRKKGGKVDPSKMSLKQQISHFKKLEMANMQKLHAKPLSKGEKKNVKKLYKEAVGQGYSKKVSAKAARNFVRSPGMRKRGTEKKLAYLTTILNAKNS